METPFIVKVSVITIPARRQAYWSEDGKHLILEALQPLDHTKKPLKPLEAFRRLWRALEGGAGDGFSRFREAIPTVVTMAGCLAPHPALPEPPCVAGLIEVEPTPLLDTFLGWLEATVRVHLWVKALNAKKSRVAPFVVSWLKSVHQHLGIQGETWREHYTLLFSREQHQHVLARLERLGVEHLTLPFDAPINAAARLVSIHQGRQELSSREIRKHLHTEGLRGLRIPPTYPSIVCDTPVVAEIGLYHLALLRLSRSGGLKACEVCGALFQPQRSTARYCSGRCRTAAYRGVG